MLEISEEMEQEMDLAWDVLCDINAVLMRALSNADQDVKRATVLSVCEALLTDYLLCESPESKKYYLDELVSGVSNGLMLEIDN